MGKDAGGYFNLVSTNGTNNYNLTGYSSGILTWSGVSIGKNDDTDILSLKSGADDNCGGQINLYGKNQSSNLKGSFLFQAFDGTNRIYLVGYPNGALYWGAKNIAMQEDFIPRSGGSVMTGRVIGRVDNTDNLDICGGTSFGQGASIALRAKDSTISGQQGVVLIFAADNSNNMSMYIYPNGTWTWTGQAVQITSDQRLKQQITQIDNALLDAWEDVTLCQFKYNDAVDQKGDNARLHTGYVVQQIDEACQKHNIDISEYGLYCHEEYPERTEEVTIKNEDGTTSKETKVIEPAKEHYSLRYTETLVVECAYLRRENSRLKERLSKIEKLLNI